MVKKESFDKGLEQGIEQKEMVISMKNEGLTVEKIAKISNLTTEEIEKILQEQ